MRLKNYWGVVRFNLDFDQEISDPFSFWNDSEFVLDGFEIYFDSFSFKFIESYFYNPVGPFSLSLI